MIKTCWKNFKTTVNHWLTTSKTILIWVRYRSFFLRLDNFQTRKNRESLLRSSPFSWLNFLIKSLKILISQGFDILIQNLFLFIAVFEEQDFWEKLHYKLPHKKMQRIQTNAGNAENPNQTEIELEPFVNGVNHNSV